MTEALLEIFEMDQRSGLRMIEVWRKWMCDVGQIPSMSTYDEFIAHRRDDIGIVYDSPPSSIVPVSGWSCEQR